MYYTIGQVNINLLSSQIGRYEMVNLATRAILNQLKLKTNFKRP